MPFKPSGLTPQERFWAKVEKTATCWVWCAAKVQGYGTIGLAGKNVKAHRLAYEWLRGPIPSGLTLDHLCRNRACVNPDHLEPVTSGVNTLRGDTFVARNAAKTHCMHGHPLSGTNLVRRPNRGRVQRTCRTCEAVSHQRYRRKLYPAGPRGAKVTRPCAYCGADVTRHASWSTSIRCFCDNTCRRAYLATRPKKDGAA